MRVMVIVKATESSEKGEMPSEQLLADMGRFNEELVAAGIMKAGDGLKPSSEGKRVHFSGNRRDVTDGPFIETNELIAGFWLWEVESMEQAVEWVKRCPNPMLEDSDIDIRPLYELEDFGEPDAKNDWREKEQEMRDMLLMQESNLHPYLFFGGCCEEALEFYKEALGARIGMVMRHGESPEPAPEGMLPEGFENKIMHAEFNVGPVKLLASDGCGESAPSEGFRLTLIVPNEALADRVFEALAAEGSIDMPLAKTFWSPRFGMVTDRFGIGWMIMVECPERAAPMPK